MAELQINPLLSTQKSSDSGLQVILHPLVLLTISDYITRHTLRDQPGPIVGALLGQQNGREITIEHAFECLVEATNDQDGSEVVLLESQWFSTRLQQLKDVHKVPPLDLVGWFTILPSAGPQLYHLPIHQQILQNYNESAILLGFHPSAVSNSSPVGKLPITVYESNLEADTLPTKLNPATDAGESIDQDMKDGEEEPLKLKFKELSYSVETGEAEMISVDFVARGGGNATAVDEAVKNNPAALSHKGLSKKAEKQRAVPEPDTHSNSLSNEEQELISSLTAKANAIKMLHSRISILTAYLENLSPSYVSTGVESTSDKSHTPVNHSILRSIQALLNRLTLLVPPNNVAFGEEVIAEQNDVHLVDLLSKMTSSIKDAKELGQKFHVVDSAKVPKKNQGFGGGPNMSPQTWEGSAIGSQSSYAMGMDLAQGL